VDEDDLRRGMDEVVVSVERLEAGSGEYVDGVEAVLNQEKLGAKW
jgi:hypothetical protein